MLNGLGSCCLRRSAWITNLYPGPVGTVASRSSFRKTDEARHRPVVRRRSIEHGSDPFAGRVDVAFKNGNHPLRIRNFGSDPRPASFSPLASSIGSLFQSALEWGVVYRLPRRTSISFRSILRRPETRCRGRRPAHRPSENPFALHSWGITPISGHQGRHSRIDTVSPQHLVVATIKPPHLALLSQDLSFLVNIWPTEIVSGPFNLSSTRCGCGLVVKWRRSPTGCG